VGLHRVHHPLQPFQNFRILSLTAATPSMVSIGGVGVYGALLVNSYLSRGIATPLHYLKRSFSTPPSSPNP
jgi:hypothetical protein